MTINVREYLSHNSYDDAFFKNESSCFTRSHCLLGPCVHDYLKMLNALLRFITCGKNQFCIINLLHSRVRSYVINYTSNLQLNIVPNLIEELVDWHQDVCQVHKITEPRLEKHF